LIKELGIDNIHLATLHTQRGHFRKRKSWTIISLFCVPLEFQPEMKNWIFRHSTGFLNYASVVTNSIILLGLPKVQRNLSKWLTSTLSAVKSGLQNYYDTSYLRGSVRQLWILKNSKYLLEYIQPMSLSSCNSIKTFDFSTIYGLYNYFPFKKIYCHLRYGYFVMANQIVMTTV
jgi:hypothetical protein